MGKCIRDGCNGKMVNGNCYMCGHDAEPKLSAKTFPNPRRQNFTGYYVDPDRTYGREYHAVGWFVP